MSRNVPNPTLDAQRIKAGKGGQRRATAGNDGQQTPDCPIARTPNCPNTRWRYITALRVLVARFTSVTRLYTPDRLAVFLSILGIIVSYLVTDLVFDRMPHIEDEAAYVWQARVIAHGRLTIPTPPHAKSYLVPFVVDYQGQRFGKYPPGWPALLAVGVTLGLRSWLNPLLAGLGIWLIYQLGKRFFSKAIGLLAAGLMVTSPFFLMNSGSLLSHPFGLVLSTTFAMTWMDLFDLQGVRTPLAAGEKTAPVSLTPSAPLRVLLAGGSLGMLVLTRPFTALAVAIPFGLHGLFLLVRGSWPVRRRVLAVGLVALAFLGMYFAWQKAVTGDAMLNPYELWWPYDKIGFGKGYGVLEKGHNIRQAIFNTRLSLISGAFDLFGWGELSWIFIPFGLWAMTFVGHPTLIDRVMAKLRAPRKQDVAVGRLYRQEAWMLFGVIASLVILYMVYWIGSELFGPRYYYESLFSLTLLSGAGIAFLAGWPLNPSTEGTTGNYVELLQREDENPGGFSQRDESNHMVKSPRGWRGTPAFYELYGRLRAPAIMLLVVGLVGYNLVVYLPGRLQKMHGLYGSNREILRNFLNARIFEEEGASATDTAGATKPADIQPALIIVHSDTWHFYGALLELEDPFLSTPYVFAWSGQPATDAELPNDFPGRTVFHYYQDEPGVLYRQPRKIG
jgi:4-amino-4-deoxy-L-arabinose transferase-like glycosyltransferase